MRQIIFAVSANLILLITCPMIMVVQAARQKFILTELGCRLRLQIGRTWRAILMISNFSDDVLEKFTLQVHLTPGAVINAMTVFLRWDFKNTAYALDPNNGRIAAVPNKADPLVFEQQVSSTLVDFRRANLSAQKFSGCGFENHSFIVAPTTPVGQSVMYLGCLVR
jgi:hypothetical protein